MSGECTASGNEVREHSHTRRAQRSTLFRENHVRRLLTRRPLHAAITERAPVHPFEQRLAASEQHGRESDVQLVDQPFAHVLTDRRHPATDAHSSTPGPAPPPPPPPAPPPCPA